MNAREPHTTSEKASHDEPCSPIPDSTGPQPGDLILVERSEWYALQDGELLRVCENAGWVTPGRDIFVAPRHQVRTFWGPDFGSPDGEKPLHMSTSGGPFKSITLSLISPLERIGTRVDSFWRWQDRPRAGGGVEYEQEVTVWKLACLPDTGTFLSSDEEARR
jgi:hypothetical protein